MALYLTASLVLALRKVKKEFIASDGYSEIHIGYGRVSVPGEVAVRWSEKEEDMIPMSTAYGKEAGSSFNLNAKGIAEAFPPATDAPCYYLSDEDSEEIHAMGLQNVWLAEH